MTIIFSKLISSYTISVGLRKSQFDSRLTFSWAAVTTVLQELGPLDDSHLNCSLAYINLAVLIAADKDDEVGFSVILKKLCS